jgi:hypothetical protein
MILFSLYIWVLPAFKAEDGGQWIGGVTDQLLKDPTGGRLSILGFSFPIPLFIPYFVFSLFFGVLWFV